MGVRGLTTFVEGNKYFLQDVKLRDCRLLIDGSSLYFSLYFNHGLDQQHGGDYDTFYTLVTEFLAALATCNIKPFIVVDGGMDPSEKKFATLCQRLQSKIKEADNISHGRHGSVLPLLTKKVFIQTLIQSGVPLVQCPSEADWEIACLARQWNCPLLSNDSDFYIFDLPGGYLPIKHFQWMNLRGRANQSYLPARRYTTDALCRWFGGLNKDLLPLCAVLSGNDYSIPRDLEHLLYLIDVIVAARGGERGRGKPPAASRIERILVWLSNFSGPAEALEEITQLVQEDALSGGPARTKKKSALSSKLRICMQEYNIACQNSLAGWFSEERKLPEGWTRLELPECLLKKAAQGLVTASVVDAFVMQRVMLNTQVENTKLASSHCCAKSIRQFMYGILLCKGQARLTQGRSRGGMCQGGGGREKRGTGQDSSMYVEEYDRSNGNMEKKLVEAHQLKTPVSLHAIGQVSPVTRTAALFEALGVTESALLTVPLHWKLAVAVTVFWHREAKPTPTQPQLHALLMGFAYGEINLRHADFPKHPTQERDLCAALVRHRVRPGGRNGLDLVDAHSYSQWQACLSAALCLNHLLLQPIPDPYLSWLFSGTLVHGLVKYLKGGRTPESLMHISSLSERIFSSLLDVVNKCICASRLTSASGKGKRQRRTRKKDGAHGSGSGQRSSAVEEINNRFALLMSEDDEED